jgi:diguanylate cyclase
MMNTLVVDLIFGIVAMGIGAVGAIWLSQSHLRSLARKQGSVESHHAAKVLVHLQELATRVAFDVDKHNDQVEEISETLNSVQEHEPKMIVDVVAKLIQANQQMHEKLASTEDKLREQAQKIQTHAAEARTDALTLLVNRRAFDDELARRCAEYIRQGNAFSLIMSDVDNFKEFNDAHGHPTGDEVLRGVAKMLRRKTREMDLVARYGGEEFAVILPGTNLNDAEMVALRACEGVEKTPFNHEGKELHVTMSFGVAEVNGNEDGAALVSRSDKALYAAKESGRNSVYVHDGEMIRRATLKKLPILSQTESRQQDPLTPAAEKTRENTIDSETQDDLPSTESFGMFADLPCRTSFCQQVRSRTAEWRRGGPIFSIALIEVNQFDAGNGNCSQRARETAMQTAKKFLASTVREMDLIGCYAPGCFALLLPTAELVNAIRLGERLREGFSQYNASAGDNQPNLTLSVGVVQIMEKDDFISVLKRAEAALDAADRRGGNRSYYHDGERCAPITAMLETMEYLS